MTESFTIVEPSFEFIPPALPGKELEFLEICCRTCYKSEDKIREGSAEKLLSKVYKEYEHFSVIEHQSAILEITTSNASEYADAIIDLCPLFAQRISRERLLRSDKVIISGNLRMWVEFFRALPVESWGVFLTIRNIYYCLAKRFPFFFGEADEDDANGLVHLLDENPLTNKDNLSKEDMMKHMTLTGRFIGSRSMSHQLVRHRKMVSFSQESMRFCNYGKKGLQVILPPKIKELATTYSYWRDAIISAYDSYNELLASGIPPEDARFVLPNATKTEVIVTAPLNMWNHMIQNRGHNPHAQWEIRDLFLSAEKQFHEVLPGIF